MTLSLNVNAAVVAEAVNAGGGSIALTDLKCTSIQNTFIAYTYISNGKSLMGCWTSESNRIFIQWNDGDLRSYPIDMFRQPVSKKNYM